MNMKRVKTITACLVFFSMICSNDAISQRKILRQIKEKTKAKANQKVDETTTKGVDKGFSEIDSLFKKKEVKENDPQHIDKENESPVQTETSTVVDSNSSDSTTEGIGFGLYTKFTFEPGNKIIFYDDFAKDKLGDFPLNWETNGSGEVVTNSLFEGNWFSVSGRNGYFPLTGELPENYTLEFDIVTNGLAKNNSATSLVLNFLNKKSYASGAAGGHGHFSIGMSSSHTMSVGNTGAEKTQRMQTNLNRRFIPDEKVHFSIAVNKKRLRVWMNEDKVIDNPTLLVGNMGRFLLFETYGINPEKEHVVLLSNMKLAEAAEDMRSTLLESGRFSTTGIYFNTGKADIKPESFAIIKSVAIYLKENPDVNMQIIGHTDAQGEESFNMQLSESRALAVKQALINQFQIEESRISTLGKGESEPTDDNSTEKGRANNRRVEFVKN